MSEPGPGDFGLDDADADLLAPPPRRTNRWTLVLAGALIAVLGFGAGALVQRETGDDAAAAFVGGPFARGASEGGRSGFGPGGFTPPGGSASREPAAGNASGGAVPAVIGTVVRVEGDTLVVRNLAGEEVTVTVPDGTKVTTTTTVELSTLAPGTTVTVSGTKDSGGVTASAVTARPKEDK